NIEILLEIVFGPYMGYVLFHSRGDLKTTEEWHEHLLGFSNDFSFHYSVEWQPGQARETQFEARSMFDRRRIFYTYGFNVDGLMPKPGTRAVLIVLHIRNSVPWGTDSMDDRRVCPILGDEISNEMIIKLVRMFILASSHREVRYVYEVSKDSEDGERDGDLLYEVDLDGLDIDALRSAGRRGVEKALDASLSVQLEDFFERNPIAFDLPRDYEIYTEDENNVGEGHRMEI